MQNDPHTNPQPSPSPLKDNKKVLAGVAVVILFAAGVGVKAYLDHKAQKEAERQEFIEYGLPSDERDATTWSTYESPDSYFTAKFPHTPEHEESELPVENKDAVIEYNSYYSQTSDDTNYFVSISKYQGADARLTTYEDLEKSLNSMVESDEANEVVSSEKTSFEGHEALDAVIRNGELILKTRMFTNEEAIVQIMMVAPETNGIDQVYDAFLSSFVLL